MTTVGNGVGRSSRRRIVLAFAKLQGENFEYYMQKYSIILGRGKRKKSLDVDLRNFGGGLAISRRHAHIFYDFDFRCFALQVLGRNGCTIRSTEFLPGSPPIKLESQDLIQIGEARFYFLLPTRSFFETLESTRQMAPLQPPLLVAVPVVSPNCERNGEEREYNMEENLGVGHGEGNVNGSIVESNAGEAELLSDVPYGGELEADGQIAPFLPPPLVVASPTSNNEKKGEAREGDGEDNLGVGHDAGVSDMIVEDFSAGEAGSLSSEPHGAVETAKQIDIHVAPELVSALLTSTNNERKGEEKEDDKEESQGTEHGKGFVSGLIVEEFNANEDGGSNSEQSGAFEVAIQIESPLAAQLMMVPLAATYNQNTCEEKEGERKERAGGVEHGEGNAIGLIVEEFSYREAECPFGTFEAAKEAGGLSSEHSGALEATKKIKPPLPCQLMVVPLASHGGNNCEEKEGEREESPGVQLGQGDVCGLIVGEFSTGEAEDPSSRFSGVLGATKEVALSPHSPLLMVLPNYPNNKRKERDSDMEEILDSSHGESGGSDLVVEEFNAREVVDSPGIHSSDIEHSLTDEKQEPVSRGDTEADNQKETPHFNPLKIDLPCIKGAD